MSNRRILSPRGGSLISEEASASLPPPEPPQLETMPPQPPTPNEISAPAMSALTVNTTATSFAMNAASAPGLTGKGLDNLAKKAEQLGQGMNAGGAMAKGGTAMRFFGMQTTAESVVTVVDISGSMVMGSKSARTYDVLEREIGKLVRELSERNSFGIVVFSREAESFQRQLVRATREDKERAFNWLKRLSPETFINPRASEKDKDFHRGTRADLGLKRAFELQPDVIFFVSDGEPTGANPAQILKQVEAAQANRPRRAAVHTIAYLADSGQKFMRELAEKNGGNFREVNPRDVR